MLWNEPYLCENRCKLRSRESLQITKAKWWHSSCSLFPHYIRPHTIETVIWLLLFAACFSDSCVLRLGRPRGSLGSFRPSEVGRPHWHNHIIADGHTCNCNMRTRIRYNASTHMTPKCHTTQLIPPIPRIHRIFPSTIQPTIAVSFISAISLFLILSLPRHSIPIRNEGPEMENGGT